jgi:hypothetical protein
MLTFFVDIKTGYKYPLTHSKHPTKAESLLRSNNLQPSGIFKHKKVGIKMTGSLAVAAFVQTQPALRQAVLSKFVPHAPAAIAATSAMSMLDPAAKSACVSFFDSFKTPATLIAAASLAALFTMTKEVKDTSGMTKMKIFLLRVYHVFSLLSLILSWMTVLTAQAATTMLLLNNKHGVAVKGLDAYNFLRTTMNFEFVITRWSYVTSIIMFLCSATFRMVLDFALFTKKRRLAGTMVVSMMTGVICSILSYANTTQQSWPNLWYMTKEVGQVS